MRECSPQPHVIHQVSGVTYQVLRVRGQVSGVMCHMSGVLCHISGVICQVSHVMCYVSHVMLIYLYICFSLDKVVELVGGGSVIKRVFPQGNTILSPYPSFKPNSLMQKSTILQQEVI